MFWVLIGWVLMAFTGEYYWFFLGGLAGLYRYSRDPEDLVEGLKMAKQGFDEYRSDYRKWIKRRKN